MIENLAYATLMAICFMFVSYLVIAVWWDGIVEAANSEELAKSENCYAAWDYNIATQERWLKLAYCGEPK